jgi:hypothetical protein
MWLAESTVFTHSGEGQERDHRGGVPSRGHDLPTTFAYVTNDDQAMISTLQIYKFAPVQMQGRILILKFSCYPLPRYLYKMTRSSHMSISYIFYSRLTELFSVHIKDNSGHYAIPSVETRGR